MLHVPVLQSTYPAVLSVAQHFNVVRVEVELVSVTVVGILILG
jgi:hypothetical protein